MRPKPLAVVAAAALLAVATAACSGDGEGTATTTTSQGGDSGCPVEPARVGELVGSEVELEEESASATSCTYLGDGGGRIVVVVERLAEGAGLDEARTAAEADAGPLTPLPDGLVTGADDGWVVAAGRAVQVAAAHDQRLVTVAVADPGLDAATAQAIAGTIAGEVLGG